METGRSLELEGQVHGVPVSKHKAGDGPAVAQRLRVLASFAEDLSSVPVTHVGRLTTACDSRSRGNQMLSLGLEGHYTTVCKPTDIHITQNKVFSDKTE